MWFLNVHLLTFRHRKDLLSNIFVWYAWIGRETGGYLVSFPSRKISWLILGIMCMTRPREMTVTDIQLMSIRDINVVSSVVTWAIGRRLLTFTTFPHLTLSLTALSGCYSICDQVHFAEKVNP